MNFVYVLRSLKDKKLYVGLAKDVQKRLIQHNEGSVRATQGRRPLVLIYQESYDDRGKAAVREKQLKTGIGREELKIILDAK